MQPNPVVTENLFLFIFRNFHWSSSEQGTIDINNIFMENYVVW